MPNFSASSFAASGPEPTSPLRLRPMGTADLDAVVEIEHTFTAPWTREMFVQELSQAQSAANNVAEWDGQVVGYALWWYVADEVHIVNVAVHTEFRRRGVARVLLRAIFDAASERGMTIATLEVRVNNTAATTLYEALGFQKIAIRKRYYADNGEDAVVMLKALRTSAAAAPESVPDAVPDGEAGRNANL